MSIVCLQGLRFHELAQKARELGYDITTARQVWLIPPANFWRHLRQIPGHDIYVPDNEITLWILELLKAIYGLIDGPILFRLASMHFLVHDLGFYKSVHDHNFMVEVSRWKSLC